MLTVQLILLLVPPVLLASIALQRAPGKPLFLTTSLALLSGLAWLWLVMPWDVVSVYYRMAIPVLCLPALVIGFRRIGTASKPSKTWQRMLTYAINIMLIALFGFMNLGVLPGYMAPAGAMALASPLEEGRYVVGQGGASPLLNHHFRVSPQNHALDIIGLNAWGARRQPFGDHSRLENYAIYGATVIAPCAGEVIVARDGLSDLAPGQTDRENLAGNHVVLACDGAEVVLAHLQRGSVGVAAGDTVATGTPLARVGNSGNTSEPHLHIHIERGGTPGEILDGEAVPFSVEGRHLVRNSRF